MSTNPWFEITPEEERAAARASACPPSGATCKTKMHIAVFFDGIGLNMNNPQLPISNIGRLYEAFPDTPQGAMLRKRVYIPGLGTDLDISRFEFMAEQARDVGTEILQSNTVDKVTGLPEDILKDAATDVVVKGSSPVGAVRDTIADLPGAIQKGWRDALRNPGKAARGIVKDAAGSLARSLIDQIDPLRDSEFMFELNNNGVAPRFSRAMSELKAHITGTQLKVEEIQVSVYGTDWGGAMARAFMTQLCGECDGDEKSTDLEWTFENETKATFKLVFAGLFDSVGYRDNSTVGFLAGLVPFAGLSNELSGDQELPRATKAAAHFMAAHDTRWRLHTIGGAALVPVSTPPFPINTRQERLYPGLGRDVAGSFGPDTQGRNLGIGKVAVQDMYRLARLAGVPYNDLAYTKGVGNHGADFDLASTSRARYLMTMYDRQVGRMTAQMAGLPYADDAIEDIATDEALGKAIFTHRMLHTVWMQNLVLTAMNYGQIEDHLWITVAQAWIDIRRIHLIQAAYRTGRRMETWAGASIMPPTNYQHAVNEVLKVTDLRLMNATQELFSTLVHAPVDPPDTQSAIQRLPNNTRSMRERFVDDGDDLRVVGLKERAWNAAEKALEAYGENAVKYPMSTIGGP